MAGLRSSQTRCLFNPPRTQVGDLRYSRQGCRQGGLRYGFVPDRQEYSHPVKVTIRNENRG